MNNKKIKIESAKGKSMLHWVGKAPLNYVKSFPAQLLEVFNSSNNDTTLENFTYRDLKTNWSNLLLHGDNKEIMGTLLEKGFRGKIDLIYIDPPFMSGTDYARRVKLRGVSTAQLNAAGADLIQQTMYFDMWNNDAYLQFMYERLMLLKELLNNDGVLWLHCDDNMEHQLRLLLDEVFGPDNFLNWVAYRTDVSRGRKKKSPFFGNNLNILFIYAKNKKEAIKKFNLLVKEEEIKNPSSSGFLKDEKGYFSTSDPGTYTEESLFNLAKEGRLFVTKNGTYELDEENKKVKIKNGKPRVKYYLKERNGKFYKEKVIDNVWEDILGIANQPGESVGFATQKINKLLERVIISSSNPGDIVLDCFIGSGTTAAVAQKLGRRWIGCDINKRAIQITAKRIQKIIQSQLNSSNRSNAEKEINTAKYPIFAIYKVNNYDLKLLKTEATELAIKHIGIRRVKTDPFFEGTLGKSVVKIIDFNHPLTVVDLQLIQDELQHRPNNDRDITIVCLGQEIATKTWIETWNKKHPVNKIHVIELRTDKKYGKFLIHTPDEAEVEIERIGATKAKVTIVYFISPTIVDRLNIDNKVFKTMITDDRSMIDTVLIDNNYNGKVFHAIYADIPEKKDDLVAGEYEIEIPETETEVAVKITDMLGEEVVVTKRI